MCGVIGALPLEGPDDRLLDKTFELVRASRNRGHAGFGFSVLVEGGTLERNVAPTLRELYEKLQMYKGRASAIIAQARYPTSGPKNSETSAMQPFHVDSGSLRGLSSFGFNGTIVNAPELAQNLIERGYSFTHDPLLDTEVLQKMIEDLIKRGIVDQKEILTSINNDIDGCCNIILLDEKGNLSAAKDKWGFRPLAYSILRGVLYIASEDSALRKIGCRDIQFIGRRKILQINGKTKAITKTNMHIENLPPQKQGCFFEVVYFAQPETMLWGEPAAAYRRRFGQALGEEDIDKFSADDTVVIDIPESSEDAAKGYADRLGLPYLRAITKNPDAGRLFIAGGEQRAIRMKEKYIFNPLLKPFIKGKRVVMPDDSIVRGDTLEYVVPAFRDFYEPSEIHLRIPSPAVVAPCFYGINLAKTNELVAPRFFKDIKNPTSEELKALASHFGATSLRYLTRPQLIDALQMHVKSVCLGCVTGDYPTPYGQREYDAQRAPVAA